MKQIRIGLIGCGGIGAVHAKAWSSVDGAELGWACDSDIEKARAVTGSAVSSAAEMIKSGGLDAIDICTPPDSHPELVRLALDQGLPVLCEKPLARTSAEARPLVELSERSGVLLMTAFCHRFHPPVEVVLGAIHHGTLGRVLMFRNRFGALFQGVENRWFSDRSISGGGALMDTSVHSVDLFRHLVGEVAEATAYTANFHSGISGVEDSAAMLLRSEDGALGVIEASWINPWSANVVEIYGDCGAAVINYDTGATLLRRAEDEAWESFDVGDEDRFQRELQHFAAAVRGDEEPRVTGRDGLRALEVIEQALAS